MRPGDATVLLVDASTFYPTAVRRQLAALPGVAFEHARSLAEAAALVGRHGADYALALLDAVLPDDGDAEAVEMCRRADIPTLVMARTDSPEFRERMRALGVIDYVVKDSPAAVAMLAGLATRILRNRAAPALVVAPGAAARGELRELLAQVQFDTLAASDGPEALAALRDHPGVRLVVGDFDGRDGDAASMIRGMRISHPRDRLAIIGIAPGGGTAAAFVRNGASNFIARPFAREDFLYRVGQTMDALDLAEELRDSANRDPLTGLFTRRYMTEMAAKLHASQRRGKATIAVILIEIDQFQPIRDRHGDEVAEAVQAAVADALRANSRDTDVAARLGNELFCLIAVNLAADMADAYFGRVRRAVAAVAVAAGAETVTITASLGACVSPLDSLAAMMRAAEAALARARQAGRDRCEIC